VQQPESKISRAIRIAINRTGRARIRPNIIMDPAYNRDGRPVGPVGLGVGSPDFVGVIRGGRSFCLEIKTETGRTRESQRQWHKAARDWGVFVAVVRSVEEALEALARAEQGACE